MAANTLGYNITFPIYNANGTPFHNLVLHKATVDSVVMSLGDKITGDVYYPNNELTVTMQEYIEYRLNPDDDKEDSVKYVLVNPPTIVREGMVSDNTELKGMTKYSFEFYHPMCMLGNIAFMDVAVTSDEEKYLSQNKTFSWIGYLPDLVAKLNKNLQGTQWVVVVNTATIDTSTLNTLSDVMSFDKKFVSDVLKDAYDMWKVPFVIDSLHKGEYTYNDENNEEHDYYDNGKRFVILFGLPSNEILDETGEPFVFKYGQGVGLKNNSRTPKNNKIVTRIVGYGSETNVPWGYPQIQWYGDQTWDYTIDNNPNLPNSYPIYNGIVGGMNVRLIKHPFTRTHLMPTIYSQTVFNKVSPYSKRIIDPNEVPSIKSPTQSLYERIDKSIKTARTEVEKNAFGALKVTLQNIIRDDEETTQSFGDRQTLSYDGSVTLSSDGVKKTVDYVVRTYDSTLVNNYERGILVRYVVNPSVVNNNDYDPDTTIIDHYDADNSSVYPNPINIEAPSVEIHEFEKIKPELGDISIVDSYPYTEQAEKKDFMTLAEYRLNLMDRMSKAINQPEKDALSQLYGNAESASYTNGHQGGSYTYSVMMTSDANFAYVTYTSDNQNFTATVLRGDIPKADWDDSVGEDGNYVQGYFKIDLPQLSFDLYASAALTQEMTLNMRSGACIGCSFPVQVDWDDYKNNFYTDDGVFDPYGTKRDFEKYPDSRQDGITVIVQKDTQTFGTLMPDVYRQPKFGDKFVVLGISLPQEYIDKAQVDLDDAMKEYMLENNTYYYDYPLKFDEHFLATRHNILSQMHNNTIVRFQFGKEPKMALYIKQITVKYGESVLPQYNITLTDDVEIVLNKIGQVTDDVSRMRLQVSELNKFYSHDVLTQIQQKISKVSADVAFGRLTFQQGLDSLGKTFFSDIIGTSDFVSGLYGGKGWRIDQLGNAEFESVRCRSFFEVVEYLINRMHAQEGDTVFSDNDFIEKVQREVDETDKSVTYVLSLKEKYDGYVTPQMYGNILQGTINTLAAKQAGVSEVEDKDTTERDGSNSYFSSWMRVIGTHNTDNTLDVNQIRVVLYGDNEVPAGKNFEPCQLMTIARRGCIDYSDPTDNDYESVKASIERRQRFFVISTSEGRVVKYTGVSSPKMMNANYGVTIGELPEFVKEYSRVHDVLSQVGEHTDWLYAQGIVVHNLIQVDREGLPINNFIDCGEWVDGSNIENPTPRNGEYLVYEYNQDNGQYETHDVWHKGFKWRCLQHQPVTTGKINTYYEPKWNSPYWLMIEGNNNLTIEFVSSRGYSFRRGYVNTVIESHVFYGSVDITHDLSSEYFTWTRHEEINEDSQGNVTYTQQDLSWNAQHEGLKKINLTNEDMPSNWSSLNKVIFTLKVIINDGKTTRIINNQIIG